MSKKCGFKNYSVLDKRQFDLIMWNMIKSMSNNAKKVPPSSLSVSRTQNEETA